MHSETLESGALSFFFSFLFFVEANKYVSLLTLVFFFFFFSCLDLNVYAP